MKRFKSLRFLIIMIIFSTMLMAGTISAVTIIFLNFIGIINIRSSISFVLILLALNILIGTLLTAFVSYFYMKPIRKLINATEEIAKGNFNIRIDVKEDADSEFAELEHSFNRMAEDLSGIEMFRKDFINNFSHEFKTPIVSIKGFANQLLDDNLSAEIKNEYVGIIISEADRLTKLATNVLLLSRLENQSIITDKTEFMLDEQLRQCILLLEKQWSDKNIELILNLDTIPVTANFDMTSQIWINLMSNAIKFSNDNGAVTVECKNKDGKAVVIFKDNGCGMDEYKLKHIFDKFYQGDISRKSEGNGLGMAIVSRLIDMLNGTIEISSSPNKGSLFTVTLDIISPDKTI